MTKILIKTYAKINLSLYVGKKRVDGYHNISSVMQSISLCDNLIVEKNNSGNVFVSSNLSGVPVGDENIAVKAALFMKNEYCINDGFDIFIEKNIPMGGGMAGGSTNAAGVICAINELLGLSLGNDELIKIGKKIGADVPFCITGGTALCEGIGEKITKLSPFFDCYILLVNPNINISTGKIFTMLDEDENRVLRDSKDLISAIESNDYNMMCSCIRNDMQSATASICPEITKIINSLKQIGADAAVMSGSGSTCYGIFEKLPDEKVIADTFSDYWTKIARPIRNI